MTDFGFGALGDDQPPDRICFAQRVRIVFASALPTQFDRARKLTRIDCA